MSQRTHLFVQKGWPLVSDKLIMEIVMRSHFWHKALHLGRHVVLDEPELHWIPGCGTHTGLNDTRTKLSSFLRLGSGGNHKQRAL